MPRKVTLSQRDQRRIDRAISHFNQNRHLFENVAQSLVGCFRSYPELEEFMHFIKWRVKSEDSLRAKLQRKTIESKREPKQSREEFIDKSNLFDKVVDLAGVRIIHLHTEQMCQVHPLIVEILEEHQYQLAGNPTANCWDLEYEQLFQKFGIETRSRESMYTTIHYDVVANQKTKITCELQVRSLMDEVWSEVSHRVNYPSQSPSESCQDQLKVLARLTTGGTRLVDSIFKTHKEAVLRGAEVA